jgi:hypothetical protein
MHQLSGGCHCGNIAVELELPRSPATYHPRACDCEFCRKHGAAYVSDPKGALRIRIRDERDAGRYTQGSGMAKLLLCRNCGVLAAALYAEHGRLYASVNARILDTRAVQFAAAQPVSPQTLSEREKVQRWQDIWFSDVSMGAA